MDKYPFRPYTEYVEYPVDQMKEKAAEFYERMKRRRTIREFSDREVPREIVENCLKAAGTSPSGANMQPWHFVVVGDAETKKKIRAAAEEVERDFYTRRAPEYWLRDLAPLGTDQNKPYLEKAPYVIVIFSERYSIDADGNRQNHYYLAESVGIATGMLITALHHAGLATLTHTPHPMAFLRDLLGRPKSNVPYMVLVTGYPDEDVSVPDIGKKSLDEVATFL